MGSSLAQAIQTTTIPVAPVAVHTAAAGMTPFIGDSKWAQALRRELQARAADNAPVAFVGDVGTGKTLLARQLHALSSQPEQPCIEINLYGLPHEVVESELFGYVRGGFLRREVVPGQVAAAGAGTCIVSGVERLPVAVQELCLRWITEHRMTPMGSDEPLPAPARVVLELRGREMPRARETALIHPLYELVAAQVVSVLPLQERREDIVPIAEHYLRQYAAEWGLPGPRLLPETQRLLKRAVWRDHVRGVMLSVVRALLDAGTARLEPKHFPPALTGRADAAAKLGLEATALEDIVGQKLTHFFQRLGSYEVRDLYATVMNKLERPLFRLVMEQTHGNQVKAARILGINRNTLRTRLHKLDLVSRSTT